MFSLLPNYIHDMVHNIRFQAQNNGSIENDYCTRFLTSDNQLNFTIGRPDLPRLARTFRGELTANTHTTPFIQLFPALSLDVKRVRPRALKSSM